MGKLYLVRGWRRIFLFFFLSLERRDKSKDEVKLNIIGGKFGST